MSIFPVNLLTSQPLNVVEGVVHGSESVAKSSAAVRTEALSFPVNQDPPIVRQSLRATIVDAQKYQSVGSTDIIRTLAELSKEAIESSTMANNSYSDTYGDNVAIFISEEHSVGGEEDPRNGRDILKETIIPHLPNNFTLAIEVPHDLQYQIDAGERINIYQSRATEKDYIESGTWQRIREAVSAPLVSLGYEPMQVYQQGLDFLTELLNPATEAVMDNKLAETKTALSEWNEYVDLAKKTGKEVIAVDCSYIDHGAMDFCRQIIIGIVTEVDSLCDKILRGEEVELNKDSIRSLLTIPIKAHQIYAETMENRDKCIADTIKEYIERNKKSVLFTGGALHCNYGSNTAVRQLRDNGVVTVAIESQFQGAGECLSECYNLFDAINKKIEGVFGEEYKTNPIFSVVGNQGSDTNLTKSVPTFYNQCLGDSLLMPTIFKTNDEVMNEARDTGGLLLKDTYDAVLVVPPSKSSL